MKVAIIGSGTMALGIAQVFCSYEETEQIIVIARTLDKAEKVADQCRRVLKKLESRGKIEEGKARIYGDKLVVEAAIESCQNTDLIIEAVAESADVKLDILSRLSEYVSEKTVVATNTSSLSVTQLSTKLLHPENFVGMHFFNPAPVMELVEVVKGLTTSDSTVSWILDLAKRLGKSPIIVNESPGFVVNRMLIPMINEAVGILADGVATAKDIDNAMKFGAHHPMGPLALADLIGNDVNLSIMETLFEETGDPKYRPHPLLRKMVRANFLGRKSRKGFFEY